MRLRGTCFVLPATVRSVVSVAAGFGGGVTPGAGGGAGAGMAYAQSGICAVVAARSATETANGNAARTTSAANLRIKSLHSAKVTGCRKLYASSGSPDSGFRKESGGNSLNFCGAPYTSFRKGKTDENPGADGGAVAALRARSCADDAGGPEQLQHRPVAPERAEAGGEPGDQRRREDSRLGSEHEHHLCRDERRHLLADRDDEAGGQRPVPARRPCAHERRRRHPMAARVAAVRKLDAGAAGEGRLRGGVDALPRRGEQLLRPGAEGNVAAGTAVVQPRPARIRRRDHDHQVRE